MLQNSVNKIKGAVTLDKVAQSKIVGGSNGEPCPPEYQVDPCGRCLRPGELIDVCLEQP